MTHDTYELYTLYVTMYYITVHYMTRPIDDEFIKEILKTKEYDRIWELLDEYKFDAKDRALQVYIEDEAHNFTTLWKEPKAE
jgi:Mg/Co/Ni transporter MgtE